MEHTMEILLKTLYKSPRCLLRLQVVEHPCKEIYDEAIATTGGFQTLRAATASDSMQVR